MSGVDHIASFVERLQSLDELPVLTDDERRRYSRQLILPGAGEAAQRRLKAARVLVIGAGGLGSPVLEYLAAAGVGTIGVVDDDRVDESNLQRQVIHGVDRIGELKVTSAAQTVARINPLVNLEAHAVRLDRDNALRLFAEYDLVVDGADNFATRYLVADAAEIAGRPVVWGSILRYEGQVSVFGIDACYRDLFPEPPEPGEVPSCAEGGVFGVLPGMIGTVMAGEAIKLITGIGEPLVNRVQVLDAAAGRWRELRLTPDPDRVRVHDLEADYVELCGTPGMAQGSSVTARDLQSLLQRRAAGEIDFDLIDVREPDEFDLVHIPGARLLPLARLQHEIRARAFDVSPGREVILVCKTGARSTQALEMLRDSGRTNVRQVVGGTMGWVQTVDPSLPRY
ncbi:molybdopterin-synthase adenylyltransferase MoeB [Pseudoclavibacter sp. CFCC 13796]|uniref:molybdopterin-synthase adenylyltransferase MoeB n=1 Tax=Pseudoclavibacter sp. CFCC 13796 TaxID=2615179 RepID=UPI00130164CA|nr:molybdopterin-synthase adenylyltransferase MoeB [Pseudoclavibacter sp. CFCC 13796]KAB1661468.1 molybdopterin-synthase adenylyltransferase MoeB [Pseudoclavibacter sp. CFCC 13796]